MCSSCGGWTTVFTPTGTAGLSGFICDATVCVVALRYGAKFPHLDTMLIILLNTLSIIYKLLYTNTSQRHPLLIQNCSRDLTTKQCFRFCPPEYIWKISVSNVVSIIVFESFTALFLHYGFTYVEQTYIGITYIIISAVEYVKKAIKWLYSSVVILRSVCTNFHNTCPTVSGSSLHQHFFLCTG